MKAKDLRDGAAWSSPGLAFHPSFCPGDFGLSSLIARERFPHLALPALFSRKPVKPRPAWTGAICSIRNGPSIARFLFFSWISLVPPSGSGWDTPDAASWGCCCWEQLVCEPWSAPIASPVPPVLSSLQETTRCAKALSSNACRTCPGGYCTAVFLARESFSGCHAAHCPRRSYFVERVASGGKEQCGKP